MLKSDTVQKISYCAENDKLLYTTANEGDGLLGSEEATIHKNKPWKYRTTSDV